LNKDINVDNNLYCKASSSNILSANMFIPYQYVLGLAPHLFVKIHRPGDSEGTFAVFESSCHLLLPV